LSSRCAGSRGETNPLIDLQVARGRTLAIDDDSGAESLAARRIALLRPGAPRLMMVHTLDSAPGAIDLLLSSRFDAPPRARTGR
jgi:hypothetical protein